MEEIRKFKHTVFNLFLIDSGEIQPDGIYFGPIGKNMVLREQNRHRFLPRIFSVILWRQCLLAVQSRQTFRPGVGALDALGEFFINKAAHEITLNPVCIHNPLNLFFKS